MVARSQRLYRKARFEPVEAFRQGLLYLGLPEETASDFVSRWELTKVQKALNPESHLYLLKNKGNFYKHCQSACLPIPELYALMPNGQKGWCRDGSSPVSIEEWTEHLDKVLPEEFVRKALEGTLSEGFEIYTRFQGGLRGSTGKLWTLAEFVRNLLHNHATGGWLLQERLRSHPEIVRLTGSDNLQTLRIVTLIDRQGQCSIINAQLTVILNDDISDNIMCDLTGSTDLEISLNEGLTSHGVQLTGDGLGPRVYDCHPRTGLSFIDFPVPMWTQACELAMKAAKVFFPIRTIGWDIGITPAGLRIIEGNFWWNSGKKHVGFRRVLELMRNQIDGDIIADKKHGQTHNQGDKQNA